MLLQRGASFASKGWVHSLQRGFVHYYRISKGVRPNPQNPPPTCLILYNNVKKITAFSFRFLRTIGLNPSGPGAFLLPRDLIAFLTFSVLIYSKKSPVSGRVQPHCPLGQALPKPFRFRLAPTQTFIPGGPESESLVEFFTASSGLKLLFVS